jgi:dephospho-CoA kinase
MKQHIIGLAGPKQAGKSTIASMISSTFNAVDFAIADKLKANMSMIFNVPMRYFIDPELKEQHFDKPIFLNPTHIEKLINIYGTPAKTMDFDYTKIFMNTRAIMQYMGTEVLRNLYGADVHVSSIPLRRGAINVVTDVRFLNELEYLKSKRDEYVVHNIYVSRIEAELQAQESSHQSEREPLTLRDKSDFVIDNNGTFAETERAMFNVMIKILSDNL